MRRERDASPVAWRKPNGGAEAPTPEPAFDADRAFPLERALLDDGTADPAAVTLPDADLLALYRLMVLNRQLDERMIGLQRQGRIGFYIGSIGEEATVLGSARAMEPQDWLFPSYREHGAARADEHETPLAPCHCDPSTPAPLPPAVKSVSAASRRCSLPGSAASARRASAAAPRARS